MRVSAFPNALEAEPNDDRKRATPAGAELPVAFNGLIERDDDVDWYRFQAKKNQTLELNVYGRRLRSPLDAVIGLYGPDGKRVAGNDDAKGADSYLEYKVPADGEYTLSIRDHLKKGGPTYVYRIEVVPARP